MWQEIFARRSKWQPKAMIFSSHSPSETERIGRELAPTLHPGQCIALEGTLGAGKTQLVRGLVTGLGGESKLVASPTFVLLHIYPTPRMKVFHLDAYRVHGTDDFESIGFGELLEQNGVVVVEWASRVAGLLPPDAIHINIEIIDQTTRSITIDSKE